MAKYSKPNIELFALKYRVTPTGKVAHLHPTSSESPQGCISLCGQKAGRYDWITTSKTDALDYIQMAYPNIVKLSLCKKCCIKRMSAG